MMTCGCLDMTLPVAEVSSSRVCFEVLEVGTMVGSVLAMETGGFESKWG